MASIDLPTLVSENSTSKKDRPLSRYIKQIKVRSTEMTYGEDNVIEAKIVKTDSFLHMDVIGYGTEEENLDEPDVEDIRRTEAETEIARRLKDGRTYKTIQQELCVSPKTISKVNRNLDKFII